MRPAAAQGSELLKVKGVMGVTFRSRLGNDQNKNGQNSKQDKNETFKDVYERRIQMDVDEADIDIHSKSYTRTGAPLVYQVRMHDYTYQSKHA